ncbi:hypothetical protein GCM10010435_92190 [Winogradskya consettensis]|uniref:Uncharacterized protein n=1 Tax=Winogradskya consettensis TaxID=113560 RepID=A0A919VXW1_9ACTN|nr:hypothetical protein Aco04nite_75970 [Actinoplanes consettensis]
MAVIVGAREDEPEACRSVAAWGTRGVDSFASEKEPSRAGSAADCSGRGCGGAVGGEFYGEGAQDRTHEVALES